jgi:hypothetical protein
VVSRILVLGVYKPRVDLPGTGRITFTAEGALNVGRLGGQVVPDALDPGSAAGQFRARLAESVDRGEHEALLGELGCACVAAGVPVDREEA